MTEPFFSGIKRPTLRSSLNQKYYEFLFAMCPSILPYIPRIARRTVIRLTVATFGIGAVMSHDRKRGTVSVTTFPRAILFRRVLGRGTTVTTYVTPTVL